MSMRAVPAPTTYLDLALSRPVPGLEESPDPQADDSGAGTDEVLGPRSSLRLGPGTPLRLRSEPREGGSAARRHAPASMPDQGMSTRAHRGSLPGSPGTQRAGPLLRPGLLPCCLTVGIAGREPATRWPSDHGREFTAARDRASAPFSGRPDLGRTADNQATTPHGSTGPSERASLAPSTTSRGRSERSRPSESSRLWAPSRHA